MAALSTQLYQPHPSLTQPYQPFRRPDSLAAATTDENQAILYPLCLSNDVYKESYDCL
jgi:hypothetical protein